MAKSNISVIYIPVDERCDNREIAASSAQLCESLKRRDVAELYYYAIPDEKSDILRRRIKVIKRKKVDLAGWDPDMPDLNDLHHTNLPWVGHTSFSGAARSFKSKHILGVAVEIIRQIDGNLWLIDVNLEDIQPRIPRLLTFEHAGPLENTHKLSVIHRPSEEEVAEHFPVIPDIPAALVGELEFYGYKRAGENLFMQEGGTWINGSIYCQFYGKLVSVAA